MMGDLISRKALIKAIENSKKENSHKGRIEQQMHNHEHNHFLTMLNRQPTVDAVPVVHGEWERIPYSFVGGYRCSCCGQKSLEKTFNYCGNCGAKMDGKKVQE